MPKPNYSPREGYGTVSTDGEWKFTTAGWTPTAPAPAPAPVIKKEEPAAVVAPALTSTGTGQATQTPPEGELGNLRIALRDALNEAARKRVENNFNAVAPLTSGNVPGTIGAVVDLIRGGIKSPVETTFSDIISGYKDATEAKRKEMDRINELRQEYGSLVPSSVTDLATALDLIAPSVDKERKLKLEKIAQEQAEDNDIESWAESYAKGEITIGNVPAKIRTSVKVRSDAIRTKLEADAKEEYKSRIAFRLEKKSSDFETERGLAMQDDNLTVIEQREVIDYIDGLEAAQKASKKSGGKGSFSFINPITTPANFTSAARPSLFGPTTPGAQSPAGQLKPFDDAFVKPFRDLLNTPR
mgnify:CR=1 FL=1